MKAAFLILLLANLAFYAYAQGYIPLPGNADDAAQRQSLNAEKIRLLSGAQVASLPKVRIVPKMSSCLEWGSFSPAEEARAEQALQGFALGDRISLRRQDESANWWVYLPPQGSKPNVDKKLAELKRLGVDDFFPIQDDGKWHYAISLGVFSSQDAANKRLETLRAKGVRTALAAQRDSAAQKVFMQIRDGGDAVVARINDIKSGYPGAEAKACPLPDDKRSG
jgi:hypothetical protein